MRQAVNYIPDATLVHVARRLAEDARFNEVIYARDGVTETVRVMLRPLLVMPEQMSYLHHVCTRIMSALARIPELYWSDSARARRAAARPTRSALGSRKCGREIGQGANPLYGRLDAVCDFTSARWQDSLRSWSRICPASAAFTWGRSPRRS